jgi:hypothetical protein
LKISQAIGKIFSGASHFLFIETIHFMLLSSNFMPFGNFISRKAFSFTFYFLQIKKLFFWNKFSGHRR